MSAQTVNESGILSLFGHRLQRITLQLGVWSIGSPAELLFLTHKLAKNERSWRSSIAFDFYFWCVAELTLHLSEVKIKEPSWKMRSNNRARSFDVMPVETKVSDLKNTLLIKNEKVKVVRLEMSVGKVLPEHKAPGELTVHCLTGHVKFTAMGWTQNLGPGSLVYLPLGELHAVEAMESSAILLTILN